MSEDETKALRDKLLEQILTKLEVMDARLQRVESKIEERGFDTKPFKSIFSLLSDSEFLFERCFSNEVRGAPICSPKDN